MSEDPVAEISEAAKKEIEDKHAERRKLADSLNQRIGTLAAGLLAVTVTFREQLAGSSPIQGIWLLYLTWVCLSVSVLASLGSVGTLMDSSNELIKMLAGNRKGDGRARPIFRYFPALMLTSFALALVLFTAFAILNT